MITSFARENIIWYPDFLPVCLVFTPKKCRTQFRIYALANVTQNGWFSQSANLTLWGKRTEEMSGGYSREHVQIFNLTEILGWGILEGGNLNSLNSDLLESILCRSSIMRRDTIYLSFSF